MDHQVYSIFKEDVFSSLTKGLKVAQCMKTAHDSLQEEVSIVDLNKRLDELAVSVKLFCSFCNVAFEDSVQQRMHYKLDWHRYNLKQNLLGRSRVNEEEFQRLADDVSSISGSESETERSEEEEDTAKTDVAVKIDNQTSDASSCKLEVERHSKAFFENADGKILSVYRCILHDKKIYSEKDVDLVNILLQYNEKLNWAIIMLGGGHFAAAIFNGNEAVVHKTFHSYTVRARQGGTQSSRDGRSGGSHPKSSGASLRRYNEASFNQHVQDILTEWMKNLETCSIILCRAVGHNRSILFGGRNPPLNKNDPRVRTIPFPTRRATFKEVQRIHSILSSIEVYGSAEKFQTSFPTSPRKNPSRSSDKRVESNQCFGVSSDSTMTREEEVTQEQEGKETHNSRSPQQKKTVDRAKSRPSPRRSLPEIVTEILAQSSPEISDLDEKGIVWIESDQQSFLQQELQEFEDTVPQKVKDAKLKKSLKQRKKKKQPDSSGKEKEKHSEAVRILREKLLAACTLSNAILLQECFSMRSDDSCSGETEEDKSRKVTSDQLKKCLNEHVMDNGGTLLHIVAENGNDEMLRCMLEAGCDPSLKNKKSQAPFAVSADRETRNTFRKFMGEFPDKYDYKKAQIPGPLTDEMEKELAEKRKEQKKVRRERDKERKKEETDKDRFLKLSDREKRALAAERRILESNAQGRSNIKVVTRCFECAVDITGKVPFEYDIHRFCTMDCLKRHRQKMKAQEK